VTVTDSSRERVPDGHGQRRQFRSSKPLLAAQSAVAAALPHALYTPINVS